MLTSLKCSPLARSAVRLVVMPLTVCSPKEHRPLRAWEGVDSEEGVRTRHRFAGSESALSTSHQNLYRKISSTKKNKLRSVQQEPFKEGQNSGLTVRGPKEDKKHSRDVDVGGSDSKLSVSSKQQSRPQLNVVTTCEDNVSHRSTTVTACERSTSTSAMENDFHVDKGVEKTQLQTIKTAPLDQELLSISGSPKQTSMSTGSSWQQYWATFPVFEPVLPAQMPAEASSHTKYHNNEINLLALQGSLLGNNFKGILTLHPILKNSNEEMASNSAIALNNAQETINQLRAANEDLMSANNYYRLLSEITMKASALRRGYARTAIQPADLSPEQRRLHQVIISDGLTMPNSAVERAEVLANIIKLHLSWEVENLKNGVNASASLNSFVEFAGLFVPQIRDLALANYVGGEDTVRVRYNIATVGTNLLRWIVEMFVSMAKHHAPKYLSYQAVGWYDEGLKALRAIDACLDTVCKNKMESFPEAKRPAPATQMPGIFHPRVMQWVNSKLDWVDDMAGKLQSKAPMVPNQDGSVEAPFGRTRQALEQHLLRGHLGSGVFGS
ncbi:hypothetical protein GJ744_007618 [Endocarpon pusillum]|uniref:Uncharacterized protein n=1 Tax=Endocarpon pusillum TaxID=364733 RepID=A0A8H7AI81_9EURO|nr:hypothetical protein GJ744_007618 [Endocarpon pusillum]